MVRHILADGREVKTIDGYVVKMEQASVIYNLLNSINAELEKKGKKHNDSGNNDQRS